MNEETKSFLERRIHDALISAARNEKAAFDTENSVMEYRTVAKAERAFAADLQALIDARVAVSVTEQKPAPQAIDGDAHVADGPLMGPCEGVYVNPDDPVAVDEPTIEPHVWLYRNMLTDDQALAPYGTNPATAQYAVRVADLTDEQRAIAYVAQQMEEVKSNA